MLTIVPLCPKCGSSRIAASKWYTKPWQWVACHACLWRWKVYKPESTIYPTPEREGEGNE